MFGAIATAAGAAVNGIINIFNKKTVDESAQIQQDAEIAKEQIKTNQIEAANPRLFVSGWRPYIGWVCGISLTYALIIHEMLSDIVFIVKGVSLPPVDISTASAILGGLLGLTTIIARSVDKKNGVGK